MIPYFQVLSDHVFDSLNGDIDLVLSLLLRDEESRECVLLIGLELPLRWFKAEDFLVLLRDVDLVGDLSLGEVGDLEVLFRANSSKSRREVKSSLIL